MGLDMGGGGGEIKTGSSFADSATALVLVFIAETKKAEGGVAGVGHECSPGLYRLEMSLRH